MKKTIVLALVAMIAASAVYAGEMKVHPSNKYGGSYVVSCDYSDFTTTATNTAEVLTWTVAANEAYELIGFQLVTAFDTANTNYTGSLAITVGDGTDADLYLTSTELASDGTEVYAGFGRSHASTTLGYKLYTAADTIDFTFTPNTEEATSANTQGEVRFYFRKL